MLADTLSIFQGLDEWIRRRLLMCLWKQWKKSKTIVKRLLSLGVPKEKASNEEIPERDIGRSIVVRFFTDHSILDKQYWLSKGLRNDTCEHYTVLMTSVLKEAGIRKIIYLNAFTSMNMYIEEPSPAEASTQSCTKQ